MKYFRITVLKAHNSTIHNHSTITFYIKAKNIDQAIYKVKFFPGIKRNNIRFIQSVEEISQSQYNDKMDNGYSAYDKYKEN